MKYLETDRTFYKQLLTIALPVTVQSLITMSISLMDTIMVGALGEVPLSAASLGNQFIMLFSICCMGVGMGASVLTARYFGKKDSYSLKMAITIALRLCMVLAFTFTLLNIFFTEGILKLYSDDAEVIREGIVYLRWSSLNYVLGGLSLVMTGVMRTMNIVRLPMVTSLTAFVLNLVFNYVFIFGHFGALAMGVAGAALATTIARIFEFAILGIFMFRSKVVPYSIKDLFMPCKQLVGEYMRVCIPVLISDCLLGLGSNVVAMVMGRIGTAFVSANAITMVTMHISTVFIQGLSSASSIITGQTLGAGQVQKAQKQGYTFFIIGVAFGLAGGLLIIALSSWIISFYNITDTTKQIAQQLMYAISFIVVFQASGNLLTKGVLRGGGDTRYLMVADIIFLWVVSIPLGYLAGLVWNLSPFWIYIALKADQILKAVLCLFRLRSGKWIKRIHSAVHS